MKQLMKPRVIATTGAAFVLGAMLVGATTIGGAAISTSTWTPGSVHNVVCANGSALTLSKVKHSSFTGSCAPLSTTTTTTQPPPTTTTTTAPATTTTQPSGTCPGGQTTGEDFNHGGTLGPFSDSADITASNGYTTYVENDGAFERSGSSNLYAGDLLSLCVQTASNWTETATVGPAGDGAVQGYPDVQQNFNTDPTTLTSTFNTTNPPDSVGNWESAYDLWGSWGGSDIMVWENTSATRLADNGATIQNPNAVIGGVSYTVMYYCGSTPNCTASSDTEHMLVRNTNANSGSENLQADVNYLESIGDIPSTSISQADFGWEICSTGTTSQVQTQAFTLNAYTLTGGA
jgi:hypothetical protein